MNNKIERVGNFTSSEIGALISTGKDGKSFGKPALTYIAECNMERRLWRSLSTDQSARPLSWGNLVESRAFESLGLEYVLCSNETVIHPEYNFWSGSRDGFNNDATTDIKCPITHKSFCQLVDPLYSGFVGINAMECIRNEHKEGETYYWQLVSNSILSNTKFAELIVYMPYRSELDSIREMASNFDGNQNKVAWINWATDDELPYLIDGGFYKNVNIIRFEVPQKDKELLTQKVIEAGKLLIDLKPELQK